MLTRLDELAGAWQPNVDELRERTDGERGKCYERGELHWIQLGRKMWWMREELEETPAGRCWLQSPLYTVEPLVSHSRDNP